jgi:hypothetical protein
MGERSFGATTEVSLVQLRPDTAAPGGISGAAKDSVSLISVRQLGQVRVGSVIDASNR